MKIFIIFESFFAFHFSSRRARSPESIHHNISQIYDEFFDDCCATKIERKSRAYSPSDVRLCLSLELRNQKEMLRRIYNDASFTS